jgi:hypothetical protein
LKGARSSGSGIRKDTPGLSEESQGIPASELPVTITTGIRRSLEFFGTWRRIYGISFRILKYFCSVENLNGE